MTAPLSLAQLAVLRFEDSLRDIAPLLTDEQALELTLLAILKRKQVGLPAKLCGVSGKRGPAFDGVSR